MPELIWDGKYDKETGKRASVPKLALPFQTVETVNESTPASLQKRRFIRP